jgi:hypothetical protein
MQDGQNEGKDMPVSLKDLLPPRTQLSSASASESPSSFWTDEELGASRAHWIRHYLKAGWKYVEGVLGKGARSIRPSEQMASKSGQLDFNPLKDAFAVRLGARFVSDNRYYLDTTGLWMDRNGALVDGDECMECGGLPWFVKTKVGLPPTAPAWKWNHTYCRRCVDMGEVEQVREAQEMARLRVQRKGVRDGG